MGVGLNRYIEEVEWDTPPVIVTSDEFSYDMMHKWWVSPDSPLCIKCNSLADMRRNRQKAWNWRINKKLRKEVKIITINKNYFYLDKK